MVIHVTGAAEVELTVYRVTAAFFNIPPFFFGLPFYFVSRICGRDLT